MTGEAIQSAAPLWACLVSLLAAGAIALTGRLGTPNQRDAWTFLAGFIKLGIVISMVPVVLSGKAIECKLVEFAGGISLAFRVDGLGILFALVASSLWIVTSLYSVGYMRGLKEHAQTRFATFFAISLSATLGVAFSANLLTLYLFYEMLSLATYPLVTHHQDKEARTGGRTYLTYLLGTSIGFALPALIFCYVRSGGNLEFTPEGVLAGAVGPTEALVVLLLFVFGFAKAGLMPFHSWLPGAMVAPTPVSALLHAVAVVKVGVFCILRVFTGVFGTEFLAELDIAVVVSWIAAFTVVTSSLIALSQDNLKRLLAFSTIGQLAYIILGVSFLTPHGVTGSMLHIAMHAFGKITLFFCAGAIFVACGKKKVSQLSGLGRRMPITMGAFAIGSLSVIGFPPTGGLLSKLHLLLGAAETGSVALVAVYVVSTVLNAAYFFPIVYIAFFGKDAARDGGGSGAGADLAGKPLGLREAPLACLIPLCVTALSSILLFFFPGVLLSLAELMLTPAAR